MLTRRITPATLALLAAGLALTAGDGVAQEVPLAEAVKAGDCFRYQIDMKLDGQLRLTRDGKPAPVALQATASHAFTERVLSVDAVGLVDRSARVYDKATSAVVVGGDRSERALRPERKLIAAQRHKDETLAYCPAGPLTRPESDLVGEHFDTLCVAGLLPGKPVKLGETWAVGNPAVQGVCRFEGLTKHELKGKLEKVEGDLATFTLAGPATGVEQGAEVKLTVEATGTFDLKARRLVALTWKQKDDRGQGPVSPATGVETTITLKREPTGQPATLGDPALVSIPDGFAPPAPLTALEYREGKGRYALVHGREWQLVADTGEHTVLRLMDKGFFVAQVTVTPWKSAKKGEHLSPEDFKTAMRDTSGWKPDRELQAGEVPAGDGKWMYRLSELGELDGVAVMQNFYLVAAPSGEQVVLTFTLNPKQADKLGVRDLSLAGSIEVPAKK